MGGHQVDHHALVVARCICASHKERPELVIDLIFCESASFQNESLNYVGWPTNFAIVNPFSALSDPFLDIFPTPTVKGFKLFIDFSMILKKSQLWEFSAE